VLAQRIRDFHQVGRSFAPETGDGLRHFHSVADRAAERLVHRGEQRPHLFAAGSSDRHQRLGQAFRLRQGFHERAPAELHIEHQSIDALRQLLRKDGRADQGDALHRGRDIPQGIERPVRRCQVLEV
jgi:hypothetical protein